jgi:hypothetical protein
MRRFSSVLVVAGVLAAAVASFVAGRVMTPRRPSGWLQNASAQVRQADLQFEEQAGRLAQAAGLQRDKLSALLADGSATDQQILEQANRLVESNTTLVKAVAAHLMALRSSVPPAQRQNLMASCAGCMQGQFQRRYRYRGGTQDQTAWQGRGGGRGRMRRYRGGAGAPAVVGRLQLTAEQKAQVQAADPDFDTDASSLMARLDRAQAVLLAGFQDKQISNEDLLKRADNLAAARSDLETRAARHVALIHAILSPQQRQTLAQLVGAQGIDAEPTGR